MNQDTVRCRRCSKPTELATIVWNAVWGNICTPCSREIEGDEAEPPRKPAA